MINFYRNILNGPLYLIVVVISIFLLMAIIGYVMEKKQIAKSRNDEMSKINNGDINDSTVINAEENVVDGNEIVEIKEDNAATNSDIPQVLDFNSIDTNNENINNSVGNIVDLPDVSEFGDKN